MKAILKSDISSVMIVDDPEKGEVVNFCLTFKGKLDSGPPNSKDIELDAVLSMKKIQAQKLSLGDEFTIELSVDKKVEE